MNAEREVNIAVQLMFRHAKSVVMRNITNAVRKGEITIDESKLPGLDLIIQRSIDDSYMQSVRQLNSSLAAVLKKA